MALNLSHLNLNTTFDQNLRDVVENTEEMTQACEEINLYLKNDTDDLVRATWLGTLGSYQRVLMKLTEAEASHKECLKLLLNNSADKRRIYAANLRLAHVYQWQKRFDESNTLFNLTIQNIVNLVDHELLSFACQHYGKNLFDQKRYHEARDFFQKALDIRIHMKSEELIESSRLALEVASNKICENN